MDVSIFSCSQFRSSRTEEGKAVSKLHMQAQDQGDEDSRGVQKSRPVRDLAVFFFSRTLRSTSEGGVWSCVAWSIWKPSALISDDETTHQSPDAPCDGTQ